MRSCASGSRIRISGTSCEHGNEPSVSIKDEEFLDYLSDCQLLTEESGPWSKLIS
jgi:hypothetical protein